MVNPWLASPIVHRRILGAAFAGCVALMAVRYALTRSLVAGDSAWYYSMARSVAVDHDIDMANEFEHFTHDISPRSGNARIIEDVAVDPRTGRMPNRFAAGTSLAIVPFIAAAHVIARGDGYDAPAQLAAGIGSALLAFLALWLLYVVGARMFDAERAFLGVLTVWLGTPLVYYMTIEPLMSHAISVAAVTALLALWLKWREDSIGAGRWAVLGLLAGFAAIVRYQDALFALVPVLDAAASGAWRRSAVRTSAGVVSFAACAAAIGSVQLLVNRYYRGSLWATGYPALRELHWLKPALGQTLFSAHDGLFTLAPVALLAVAGLYAFARTAPVVGWMLLGALVVQIYLVSAWVAPEQGATFGNRMLLNATPIFAIGLMRFFARPRAWVVAVAFIGLNGVLAALYCARILPDPYIVTR